MQFALWHSDVWLSYGPESRRRNLQFQFEAEYHNFVKQWEIAHFSERMHLMLRDFIEGFNFNWSFTYSDRISQTSSLTLYI